MPDGHGIKVKPDGSPDKNAVVAFMLFEWLVTVNVTLYTFGFKGSHATLIKLITTHESGGGGGSQAMVKVSVQETNLLPEVVFSYQLTINCCVDDKVVPLPDKQNSTRLFSVSVGSDPDVWDISIPLYIELKMYPDAVLLVLSVHPGEVSSTVTLQISKPALFTKSKDLQHVSCPENDALRFSQQSVSGAQAQEYLPMKMDLSPKVGVELIILDGISGFG